MYISDSQNAYFIDCLKEKEEIAAMFHTKKTIYMVIHLLNAIQLHVSRGTICNYVAFVKIIITFALRVVE